MDGTVQMDAGKVNEGRDGGKRDAGRELSQWGKRRREETGNGCGEGDQGTVGTAGTAGTVGTEGTVGTVGKGMSGGASCINYQSIS